MRGFAVLSARDINELQQRSSVRSLGRREVGPAGEEEVPYFTRFGAFVGCHVDFSHLGAGFCVVREIDQMQVMDEAVLKFIVLVDGHVGA
tara:strand:- start:25513 stop:25782 length:270 start_codon:yes stop_codon:yes gene_type:complete